MSAQEIIAALSRLNSDEIRLIKAKVDELAGAQRQNGTGETASPLVLQEESLNAFLLRVAGTAEGLPSDLAENHDHYLYGTPRHIG